MTGVESIALALDVCYSKLKVPQSSTIVAEQHVLSALLSAWDGTETKWVGIMKEKPSMFTPVFAVWVAALLYSNAVPSVAVHFLSGESHDIFRTLVQDALQGEDVTVSGNTIVYKTTTVTLCTPHETAPDASVVIFDRRPYSVHEPCFAVAFVSGYFSIIKSNEASGGAIKWLGTLESSAE